MGSTIITNPLDEQQDKEINQMEDAQRRSSLKEKLQRQSDYVFTPPNVEERIRQTAGQTLAT